MPKDIDQTALQQLLLRIVKPGVSPSDVLKAVRKEMPGARKKDIIRAAFASMIERAHHDGERAAALQDFALKARGGEGE